MFCLVKKQEDRPAAQQLLQVLPPPSTLSPSLPPTPLPPSLYLPPPSIHSSQEPQQALLQSWRIARLPARRGAATA